MFAAKNELFTRPSGYTISRSVRLRSSASAYFNRTQTAGSQTTWTWSGWVKRGKFTTAQYLMQAGGSSGSGVTMSVIADDFQIETGNGTTQYYARSTAQYRDPSAWYHVVMVCNTTSATSTLTGTPSDRLQIWVNGVQVTSFSASSIPTQNFAGYINQNTVAANIGRWNGATPNYYFDGYLTEVNFIDGQALTPSSFGETDTVTGVWKPKKYAGTYGTNGFYLNFSDNSSNTATTIGKDYSGNGNNWTPNNISVTSGVTYDSMLDVPTNYADGGNGRGNYAVLNPIYIIPSNTQPTFSNGNLTQTQVGGEGVNVCVSVATMPFPTTGKYYCEVTFTTAATSAPFRTRFGVQAQSQINNSLSQNVGTTQCFDYCANGNKGNNNAETAYGSTYTSGDTIGMAIDLDNGKIWWSKNGTWQASGDPAAGTNAAFTGLSGSNNYFTSVGWFATSSINFGQRPFAYTPPSGFNALNTQNLPSPTISNGALYMAATTYTGNGTTTNLVNSVNGVSFKPDLVWQKNRSSAANHILVDSVRGGSLYLIPNSTSADSSAPGYMTFNSNGESFTSSDIATNQNGQSYVSWQWQAGAGTTSSNTSGSITSTVSVNATAGFSVVTYTTTGSAGTVGHGLGVAPSMIILKNRSGAADDWYVYHASLGNTKYLTLDTTAAATTAATWWNSTSPTSTVFSLGSAWSVVKNYVAYCFSAVRGYSAFGSYTGNGSTDGPFVFTGFRPRWLMYKRTDVANSWVVLDSSRSTYNVTDDALIPNLSDAEYANEATLAVDFLSNGFKVRTTGTAANASGGTYVYAAFAENPYKLALAR